MIHLQMLRVFSFKLSVRALSFLHVYVISKRYPTALQFRLSMGLFSNRQGPLWAHKRPTRQAAGDWCRVWTQRRKKTTHQLRVPFHVISPSLLPAPSVLAACGQDTVVHSLRLSSGASQQPVEDKRFPFICESVSSEVNQPLMTGMGLMTRLQVKTNWWIFTWLNPFLFHFCCCRSIQNIKKNQ